MIKLEYIKYIYLDAPVIAKVALVLAAMFIYAAIVSLMLSVFSRIDQLAYNKRKARLIKIYQKRLTELLFDEKGEEDSRLLRRIKKRYLKNNESKEIMISILIDQQRNFSGELNARIHYFYTELALDQVSLAKLRSNHWYSIAVGLRELGLLGGLENVDLIASFTDDKTIVVRREAQMALVRLKGLEGLSFLDTLSYKLTEWHQLNLFEILTKISTDDKNVLSKYLDSDNTSVISFALKLVGFFKLMDRMDKLLELLNHDDREVRVTVVQTIARLELYNFSDQLLAQYPSQPLEVKVEILKAFSEIGMPNLSEFLMTEFNSTQFEISLHAAKAIHVINPNLLLENKMDVEDEYQHNQIKMQITQ